VVYGVAEAAVEAFEIPPAFVAFTVMEYAVPFVRPVMVQVVVAEVQLPEPGVAVAV
jgi:hypothetical protein